MDANKRTRILSTVGIVVILAALAFVGFRMFGGLRQQLGGIFNNPSVERSFSGDEQERSGGGSREVALPADLSGFTRIAAEGGWRVIVESGAFEVNVTASERAADDVVVARRGSELHLGVRPGFRTVTGNLEARVTMPDLEQLEIDGGADVRLNGLTLGQLRIDVDGAASVKGVDTRIEELDVDVDGAGNLDFGEARVVNARVEMDGASNLTITMDGGRLTGALRGVGNVTYSGQVSEESIRIEGLGKVRQR